MTTTTRTQTLSQIMKSAWGIFRNSNATNANPLSFGQALKAAWAQFKDQGAKVASAVAGAVGQLKCWVADEKWAYIAGQGIRATAKAVQLEGWDAAGKLVTMWVPRSCIKGGNKVGSEGGGFKGYVALWFCEKNNLINA